MLANDESAFRAAEANFARRLRNGSSCSDPAESTRILQGLTTDDSLPFYDGYRDGGRGSLGTRDRVSSPRRGSAKIYDRVARRRANRKDSDDPPIRWPGNYRVGGREGGEGSRRCARSIILSDGTSDGTQRDDKYNDLSIIHCQFFDYVKCLCHFFYTTTDYFDLSEMYNFFD